MIEGKNEMFEELKTKLDKTIEVLKSELAKVRIGRASVGLIENLNVDVYGSTMPLNQLANITVPDSRTLAIQPWDKANLASIEQAIAKSSLGLNPVNDGTMVRIFIPPLSSERRNELVKVVKQKAEAAKISIRNIRQDAVSKILAQEKNKEIGEDEARRRQDQVQTEIDRYNDEIDNLTSIKEKDITTI